MRQVEDRRQRLNDRLDDRPDDIADRLEQSCPADLCHDGRSEVHDRTSDRSDRLDNCRGAGDVDRGGYRCRHR
ncbi:hypothetical protein EFE23_18510 [Micromonospora solifontis]|uniref:Uncharacterized protein n=1 Tax=Micromonospora solifontis TaxID=2487138 RepID=A0ABX9WCS7_9ACTN|nr:hypothetical protein EFE23_18510 [Micromonospora solifontis]